jgi:xylulokinase
MRQHLMGIDLGTSSVKAVMMDPQGHVLARAGAEYPIHTPQPGYAEQNPQEWWQAAVQAVRAALAQVNQPDIQAIGLCGQMHGVTLLDAAGEVVRPSIIWADQRTVQQVQAMQERIGTEKLSRIAGTLPAAGFMGPTLMWLAQHEPETLRRTQAVLLPKDYLQWCLTGKIATDATDASATALFDITRRTWSEDICAALNLPSDILPPVYESTHITGQLTSQAADVLGLPAGIPVVAGCADQSAQAVGNRLTTPGTISVTLGTGGQVFAPLTQPITDVHLHTFCHAVPGGWYMLGAMLSAGLSLRWLRDTLGLDATSASYETLAQLAAEVPAGADGLLFLPYLIGERAPLMDARASGVFVGLSLRHGRGHLARAIMEGVAFALRQIIETMSQAGVPVKRVLAAGNGLASPVWRQIATNILNRPLHLSEQSEHTGSGAALIAGIGAGIYPDFDALPPLPAAVAVTNPDASQAAFYDQRYRLFLQVYPALKTVMHGLK